MNKIKKILVANRGEIALRVLRTCRDLGIETVAIYAENDVELPFVRFADHAVTLGDGTIAQTYLNTEKIVNIAKKYAVDAIHPGYGFLSENANFCEALEGAGFIFIGPKSDSIKLMGDKIESKKSAHDFGLPVVPGYHGENQEGSHLLERAKEIGFPVLIKATAGGGGKGMRICHEEGDFLSLLDVAKSEAKKFFNNDVVLLEKYLEKPRHIEVQVFGDGKGEARHFYERECSVQRRYQKVIEESPSQALSDELRENICQTALKLVKGLNYRGAGTVELIFDAQENFYFLEMNTRLQVEHPVSEMITGFDLVELQIRIADGESFDFDQSDIKVQGHAIECRIYAEDPYHNYFPQSGKLALIGDTLDSTVRIDSGYENGNLVSLDYDPMIAKVICHARTRSQCIGKTIGALRDLPFLGVTNNRDLLIDILNHEEFISGQYDTHFLKNNEFIREVAQDEELASLIGTFLLTHSETSHSEFVQARSDSWKKYSGWYL